MPYVLLVVLLLFAFTGCDPAPRKFRVVRMPAAATEVPICNIPRQLRVENWLGPKGQGSCVHASLKNMLIWCNAMEKARSWPWSDGEHASELRQRLDDAKIDYVWTDKTDINFLRWCARNRMAALLWWKPSHCCMFAGIVSGKDLLIATPELATKVSRDKEYVAILDNNYIDRYEFTELNTFARMWYGYGGFALAVAMDPTSPMPYQSFTIVYE